MHNFAEKRFEENTENLACVITNDRKNETRKYYFDTGINEFPKLHNGEV